MSAIDQLEKELEDLRSRFSQAFQVLDGFSQLQTHFEQLTQTQQELEQSLSQAKNSLEDASAPSELQEQYTELESQFEAKYAQLQSDILDLRHSFEATTYDLQEQLHHDRNQLKQLEQTASPAPGADTNKLDWLENSMQDLSNLIYADRSALQHLDRRLNHVKRVTDIITIVGASGFFVMTIIMVVTR
ncbi:hypothetical protein [Acaryochloris sp. CCMEE 5410]|uniref:hypothetical protein n=1 Tax=Acaryochloris sp. CCMEE 5410 TaxID=310037 RepID=UPI0002484C24|nr:hypothetical protein [Acaryochloris sp. CCMEE 5410]KAI9132872.1 hypothetical protein ON05_005635 [Acaryochloris sp. CCMEE 5410]